MDRVEGRVGRGGSKDGGKKGSVGLEKKGESAGWKERSAGSGSLGEKCVDLARAQR